MKVKNLFFTSLFCICAVLSTVGASWGAMIYSNEPVLLFSDPERGFKAEEVTLPKGGIKYLAIQEDDNERWYKVKIGGKSGWLFGGAVMVEIDTRNEENDKVSSTFETLQEACEAMLDNELESDWIRRPDVKYKGNKHNNPADIITFASKNTLVQLLKNKDKTLIHLFRAKTPEACEKFLGFAAVGMTEDELKDEIGEPTLYYGNNLEYFAGGSEANFIFIMKDGKVEEAAYSNYFGNGIELPERVYELQRMLLEPGAKWAKRDIMCTGEKVNVRAAPSLKAKVLTQIPADAGIWWTETKDRGEKYPWYEVEIRESGKPSKKGWVYGEFLSIDEDSKAVGFDEVFEVNMRYKFDVSQEEYIKRYGKPSDKKVFEDSGNGVDSDWKWKGLEVSFRDGGYKGNFTVTDPKIDLCGIRIGDPVSALEELMRAFKESEGEGKWEMEESSSLEEGDNEFQNSSYQRVFITIKKGKLSSFGWYNGAAD